MMKAVFLALMLLALPVMAVAQTGPVLIYFPSTDPAGTPEENQLNSMQQVEITTHDKLTLKSWFAPPKEKDGKVIVFFHGNAGDIRQGIPVAEEFMRLGYGVYLNGYRGYGGNPGTPAEADLYDDARASLKWLEQKGYTGQSVVLMGWSLGTAVAAQLASESAPHAVALLSAFTNLYDIMRPRYANMPEEEFTTKLKADRYDVVNTLAKVKAPVLIVHGAQDDIVPLRLGRTVYAAANDPKTFKEIGAAGHNDLWDWDVNTVVSNWLCTLAASPKP